VPHALLLYGVLVAPAILLWAIMSLLLTCLNPMKKKSSKWMFVFLCFTCKTGGRGFFPPKFLQLNHVNKRLLQWPFLWKSQSYISPVKFLWTKGALNLLYRSSAIYFRFRCRNSLSSQQSAPHLAVQTPQTLIPALLKLVVVVAFTLANEQRRGGLIDRSHLMTHRIPCS